MESVQVELQVPSFMYWENVFGSTVVSQIHLANSSRWHQAENIHDFEMSIVLCIWGPLNHYYILWCKKISAGNSFPCHRKEIKKEEKVITLRLPYSSEEKALILEVLRRVEKSCKDLPDEES